MYFAPSQFGLLHHRLVDEEVLGARLAPDLPALLARERDGLDRRLAGDVDDVERRVGHVRELDRAVRRLGLRLHRPAAGVPDRVGVPGRDGLLDDDVDRVAVLGVHHHEPARLVRGLHHLEERLVVDHHGALVGHEELVRGDALVRQLREILERAALLQIGDGDVEADVDHRRAPLELLVVRRERLGERHPGRLDTEVDQRRRAAERGRGRAGGEVVAGRRPAEEHLDVRVRVDRAGHHELSGRVDHLVCLDVERRAEERDLLALDEDVADVVVGRGDDAASLDQHGHPEPFLSTGVRGVYDGPRRRVKREPAVSVRASR